MGYYNDKQNSTNPMLDNYVRACHTLARTNHLISKEDEETIMKIAKKVMAQSKFQY